MLDDGLFTRFPKPDVGFALHDGAFPMATSATASVSAPPRSNGLVDQIPGPRRSRFGAANHHRSRDDGGALRRRRAECDQPREGSDRVRRGLDRRDSQPARQANIIPDEALVVGTIRSFKPQVRDKILAGIERTAKAVAAMADAPAPEIDLDEGAMAVMNDPAVVGDRREGVEGGLRRQVQCDAAGHRERGLFGICQRRRALDVLQHRRLRSRTRRRCAQ